MPEPGEIVAQSERYWPDEKAGPYLLRLSYAVIKNRLEVVGVEMWAQQPPTDEKWRKWLNDAPTDTPNPINSVALRMPLDRLASEALARLKSAGSIVRSKPEQFSEETVASIEKMEALPDQQRGRPAVYGPEHWAKVATVYVEAAAAREKPTLAVQNAFGVSKTTAAKWVARARQDEWLAPAEKGRVSTEPGPRLMNWQLEELKRNVPGFISHVLVDREGNVTDVSAPGAYERAQQQVDEE